ncbi:MULTISPECIES: PTS sugar transporter subunit IIB [Enterococcus]|uniref:PTS sugar transporter subunit IIB n=1 Tax=Enterococcus TaxID=1350 RepID=UPI001164314B|nr:PTS cellobiose transporter subunit IIC [Enterococcus avium]HAP3021572.1 PTS cellobiose transporter subunit IIC [Enterococcus faecalis]AYQ24090.1 PTS cellobiose transporter subunit IIC [Enterococcus avium]HBI1562575.1 PTS cellobiose transporter subunit IIC [Enterococcus faecalis]HBI1565715.1 PTS cellobiose transporter subunit IIC [Enterococcus faecalis]HBI1717736.1 PTS cellobiose transporter subunit IIC [Enterococcus faecalis]
MHKNILIICETGISASLLVSKVLEAIRGKRLSYEIDYAPLRRVEEKLNYKDYDVLLLTPQIARSKEKVKEIIKREKCNAQIIFIAQDDFRYMNIENIIASIEDQ